MKNLLTILLALILMSCKSEDENFSNQIHFFPETLASESPSETQIPLNQKANWQVLTYDKIPANVVEFSEQGLILKVNKSASPVIYPLGQPKQVKRLQVTGQTQNQIQFKGTQGEKGFDDYLFRIGLVIQGSQTLGFAQKLIAADWVKTLFNLAPKGLGVDHIYFLNLGSHAKHLGRVRNHPLSDLIKEEVVAISQESNFSIDKTFEKPKKVLALWISVDGDDTNSQFTTHIKSIKLH